MEHLTVIGNGWSKICRFCLANDTPMVDIFWSSNKVRVKMVDKIMQCAPVRITKDDQLPNFICRMCCSELEKFHSFQRKILKTERTLHRFFQQLHGVDSRVESVPTAENRSVTSEGIDKKLEMSSVLQIYIKEEITDDVDTETFIPSSNKGTNCEFTQVNVTEEPIDDSSLFVFPTDTNQIDVIGGRKEINNGEIKLPTNTENTRSKAKEKEKRYGCNGCNKRFFQICDLKRHKLRHTGEKPFQCDVCSKSFARSHHLKTHQLLHTGEKPYQCDVCNKRFAHLGSLHSHKLLHTGEKPYVCEICNKCFTQLSHLKTHQVVHNGGKRHQCDLCQCSYARADQLKRHKQLHFGEKPYQCEICDKRFTRLDHLRIHNQLHTGDRPFKCDVCEKQFSRSDRLKSHKMLHTGEKPYRCEVCDKCFSRLDKMKAHQGQHFINTQFDV